MNKELAPSTVRVIFSSRNDFAVHEKQLTLDKPSKVNYLQPGDEYSSIHNLMYDIASEYKITRTTDMGDGITVINALNSIDEIAAGFVVGATIWVQRV